MERALRPLLPKLAGDGDAKESNTGIAGLSGPGGSAQNDQGGSGVEYRRERALGPLSSAWRSREIPKQMRGRRVWRHERLVNAASSCRPIELNGVAEAHQPPRLSVQVETIAVEGATDALQCPGNKAKSNGDFPNCYTAPSRAQQPGLSVGDEAGAVRNAFGAMQRSPNQAQDSGQPATRRVGPQGTSLSDTKARDEALGKKAGPFRHIVPNGCVEAGQQPAGPSSLPRRVSFRDVTKTVEQAADTTRSSPAGPTPGRVPGCSSQASLPFKVTKQLGGAPARSKLGSQSGGRSGGGLDTRRRDANQHISRPIRPREMEPEEGSERLMAGTAGHALSTRDGEAGAARLLRRGQVQE